jgi:hypothetical protein
MSEQPQPTVVIVRLIRVVAECRALLLALAGSRYRACRRLHGGNLQQSRFFSLQLALQIKARAAGIATPVYGLEPVYHRR